MEPNSTRWSIYVGIYVILTSVIILLPLNVIVNTLFEILGLQAGFTSVLLPGTGAVIAAVAWWVVVEHRQRYTYLFGGLSAC